MTTTEHFQRTWRTLYRSGDVVEVRAFGNLSRRNKAWDGYATGIVVGYFDNEDDFVSSVEALDATNKCEAIYITLNPCAPALINRAVNRLIGGKKSTPTASDGDIERRRWLFIDFDPVRPKGISATDAEVKAAAETAKACIAYLADAGWPESVKAASGNGVHLLYQIDLPNDDESRDLLRDALKAIKAHFDSDMVTVDEKVFNASRITKCYGSVARKGDNTDERPHRRSSIISAPDTIKTVSRALLENLANEERQRAAKVQLETKRTGTWTTDQIIDEALGKVAQGEGRNNTAIWLACQIRDEGYSQDEALSALRTYAARVPDSASFGEHEGENAVNQAYKTAPRQPRQQLNYDPDYQPYDGFCPCPDEPLNFDVTPVTDEDEEPTYDSEEERIFNSKSWPYSVDAGRIYYNERRETKNGPKLKSTAVCDFIAAITEEINDEDDNRIFVVEGQGFRGHKWSIEIEAQKFGNDSQLRAILEAAAGALDGVYAGQAKHLAHALKRLSVNVDQRRRFDRTGWYGKQFLFPGRDLDGIDLSLHNKLPYGVNEGADIAKSIEALRYCIEAIDPAKSTVVLSAMFTAPMSHIAGWRNERYAVFIAGRTGSFKTSWSQVAMSFYGNFGTDHTLIKWGEGATRNSIMGLAAGAADLPLLIDNYKPQTGGGERDFVNLIHNIVEGSDKDRMNRNAALRRTREIHAWPVITGEDTPDSDAASLARVLIIEFERFDGGMNQPLTSAQSNATHLSALGLNWIEWLESEAGRRAVKDIAANLPEVRVRWADYLNSANAKAQNIFRIATNLATNELTWQIAAQHPLLSKVVSDYIDVHRKGLESIANQMAQRTAESLEGERFLIALNQLIATKQVAIIDRQMEINDFTADRAIGWKDSDGYYILPDIAMRHIRDLLGPMALNNLSQHTLVRQLVSQELAVGEGLRQLRIGGQRRRVLHLLPHALGESETETAWT